MRSPVSRGDCNLARAIRHNLATPSGRSGDELMALIFGKMASIPAHLTWTPLQCKRCNREIPRPATGGHPPAYCPTCRSDTSPVTATRRRGRARGPQRRRTTTKAPPILCPQGHAYTAWNTYWHPRGPRCRECVNQANREWRARQKAA